MKSDNDPAQLYLLAIRAIAQLGCLLTLVAGGALVAGLIIDNLLNTRPIGLAILLLGSVPVSLWVIYKYTVRQARQIQSPPTQKEGDDTWE